MEDDGGHFFHTVQENPITCKSYFPSAVKAGYSGTTIYTKVKPSKIEKLGIPKFDDEGRTTIAHFENLVTISAHFPNSQKEGTRLPYKLEYCEAIQRKCDNLVGMNKDIELRGDYNIAHKPIDLANLKANEKNAGYLPEEREWMDRFTSSGYLDFFRLFFKFCQIEFHFKRYCGKRPLSHNHRA